MTTLTARCLHYATPNASRSPRAIWLIVTAWITVFIGWWVIFSPAIFPSPLEVLNAFPTLWNEQGFGHEIFASLTVSVEALLIAIVVSLPLAYLSSVPVFHPVAFTVAKLRFVSPAVFYSILVYAFATGHEVKTTMLAIGEIVFLVTTMLGIVQAIPGSAYDDARVLRMTPWQVTWYVVVRGTIPETIDAIRDNQAMGWASLMMVEGFVRAEGGVGVLILSNEKFMSFAAVYAIALTIIVVGIGQDWLLGQLRKAVCPYA